MMPSILSYMDGHRIDRRRSASINAVLVLITAVLPAVGAIDTSPVDHTQVRPWGCRTCPIPAPPPPAENPDPDAL